MNGLNKRLEKLELEAAHKWQQEKLDPISEANKRIMRLLTDEELEAFIDGVNPDTWEVSPEAEAVIQRMWHLATAEEREILFRNSG